MKLLYTSDLHGNDSQYVRLMALAGRFKPEVVVLGGDLLPDDNAMNPAKMGQGQPQFVRNQFRKAMATLKDVSGCQAVVLIFGNHDWGSSAAAMKELSADGLVSILDHKQPVSVGGLHFLGYSCTPPTPCYVKDFERLDQPGDAPPLMGGARWDPRFNRPATHGASVLFKAFPTIAEELGALKPPGKPWVFVAHSPPYDSTVDRTYSGQSGGSRAVRAAIEKHQPLLSLHGHIHEAHKVTGKFQSRIGSTVVANPGQTGTALNHLLIDIDVPACALLRLDHGQQS